MPLNYELGTLAEHAACRNDAVMFDVSHLGTVRVEGPDAFAQLQRVLTNDLNKVAVGRAQYTHLLDESDASVLDDIIVWWVRDEVFDVMPNASNTDRVVQAIGGVDTTSTRAVIAVQGPHARDKVRNVSPEAADVPRFGVPVRDTPVKMELRLRFLSNMQQTYGTNCCQQASLPLDLALETRFVLKRRYHCMVMSWGRELLHFRPDLNGLLLGVSVNSAVVVLLRLKRLRASNVILSASPLMVVDLLEMEALWWMHLALLSEL